MSNEGISAEAAEHPDMADRDILIATARLLLNDQPCTLATIAEKVGVSVEDVDEVWRRLNKRLVRERGLPDPKWMQ